MLPSLSKDFEKLLEVLLAFFDFMQKLLFLAKYYNCANNILFIILKFNFAKEGFWGFGEIGRAHV